MEALKKSQVSSVGQDEVGIVLHEMSGLTVKKFSNNRVVKKGTRVKIEEQEALRLAAALNLPVPRVYAATSDPSCREQSIEMDFIPGESLENVWAAMNEHQKLDICAQLRDILTKMRSAPHSTGLIGSCSGGVARDLRQYTAYAGGPFATEAEFNDFYLHLVKTIPKPINNALRKRVKSNHRIVFSHGDIAQHNILVKDNRITGLLDWEYAGWYPEQWEYIKFLERLSKNQDWRNYAEYIFPQMYDEELALHQAIIRWQYP